MTEHTPGPWKKCGLDWVGSDGSKVVVSDGPAFGSRSRFPNAEANAHLIKAAPVLLEALEYMLAVCPVVDENGYKARNKACAAIATAKGEL